MAVGSFFAATSCVELPDAADERRNTERLACRGRASCAWTHAAQPSASVVCRPGPSPTGASWRKRMIEDLASIHFNPVGLAKHADFKALFSIIPARNLKKEALERTNGKDYSALPKRDGEIARMADAIAILPIYLGCHEALRVFRSRLRDNASMYDFVNLPNTRRVCRTGRKSMWKPRRGRLRLG